MGRRLHLLKRNDVFWWRRRLPRALLAHGAPAELRRSLATTNPVRARLRALRLSVIFEDVLLSHATKLRSKPLTAWQRDQILGELYRKILEECDSWAATRAPASKHLTPEDPEWHVDEYFRPGQLRSWWTTLFQCGEYGEAAGRLKPLLASHRIELDPEGPEFRELASEGMRCAIAAFAEAEETLEAGCLDDEALAGLRERHGRTPVQQVAPEPSGRAGGKAAAVRRYRDRSRPTTDWPLREIYELYVADKSGLSWKAEAVDGARKALELFEELVGLHKIGEIDHDDASYFRQQIRRLPKYHGKGLFPLGASRTTGPGFRVGFLRWADRGANAPRTHAGRASQDVARHRQRAFGSDVLQSSLVVHVTLLLGATSRSLTELHADRQAPWRSSEIH